MTDPDHDDVFEAYLKRQPVLPAMNDNLEPPAALDGKVLAQAREAIKPQAAPQRPPRWAVPVALAATVLLCLSVVINISLNTNRPSPNLDRMTASRADVKASALSNATAESNAAAGVTAQPPAARDAYAANNGERRESISGDIPSNEVVLPRAKVAATPASHAPVVAEPQASTPGESSARAAMASASRGVPVSPAATSARANAASGAGDVSASAADKAVLMAKDAGVAAPAGTPAPEQARAASAARQAAKPAAAAVAPHPADPKVWLQQIDALRTAGKTAEADAEMRRFKAAFPDYALPK